MKLKNEVDNRLRKINKRVDDAIKIASQYSDYTLSLDVAINEAGNRLAELTGLDKSNFVITSENSEGVTRTAFKRSKAFNDIDTTVLNDILTGIESYGTISQTEQYQRAKEDVQREAKNLKDIYDYTLKAGEYADKLRDFVVREWEYRNEVSRAFEIIYDLAQGGDAEAQKLLAKMIGRRGDKNVTENGKTAVDFLHDRGLMHTKVNTEDVVEDYQLREKAKKDANVVYEQLVKQIADVGYITKESKKLARKYIRTRMGAYKDKKRYSPKATVEQVLHNAEVDALDYIQGGTW